MPNSLLRAALVLGIGLAALAWGDAVLTERSARRAQRVAAEAELLASIRQARDALPRLLEPLDRAMHWLHQRQAALQRGDAREAAQIEQALAAAARRGEDGLRLAATTDLAGSVTWTSHAGALPASLARQENFLAHRQGRAQPLLLRPRPGTGPALDLLQTRPLAGGAGGFAGIAVLGLEAGRLARLLPATGAEAPQLVLYQLDGTPVGAVRNRAEEAPLAPALLLQMIGAGERLLYRPDGPGPLLLAASQPDGLDLLLVASFAQQPNEAIRHQRARRAYGIAALVTLLFPAPVALLLLLRQRRRQGPNALEVVLARLPVLGYVARFDDEGFLLVHSVGPGFEALCGWPPEQFRDQTRWHGVIELLDASQPPLAERVREGGTVSRDYRLRRPDGSLIWLRDSLRMAGQDRRGPVLLGCLQEVTREHQLAAQAAAASRLLAQNSLAASLAHELQQPLSIMALAAENALEAMAEGAAALPEVRARLQRIQAQSTRAQGVAAQLRSFARLDAASLQRVDLQAALRSALEAVQGSLHQAGVRLEIDLPATLPAVKGEPLLLEQVLLNLLLNARDAMLESPAGCRLLRIGAAVSAEGDEVVLRIADSGPGIAAAVLERVFDPFFTTKPAGKGSGLGLPLCRSVMQRFGGGIELANHAGGAEAVLRLRRMGPLPPAAPRQRRPALARQPG